MSTYKPIVAVRLRIPPVAIGRLQDFIPKVALGKMDEFLLNFTQISVHAEFDQ